MAAAAAAAMPPSNWPLPDITPQMICEGRLTSAQMCRVVEVLMCHLLANSSGPRIICIQPYSGAPHGAVLRGRLGTLARPLTVEELRPMFLAGRRNLELSSLTIDDRNMAAAYEARMRLACRENGAVWFPHCNLDDECLDGVISPFYETMGDDDHDGTKRAGTAALPWRPDLLRHCEFPRSFRAALVTVMALYLLRPTLSLWRLPLELLCCALEYHAAASLEDTSRDRITVKMPVNTPMYNAVASGDLNVATLSRLSTTPQSLATVLQRGVRVVIDYKLGVAYIVHGQLMSMVDVQAVYIVGRSRGCGNANVAATAADS